MDTRSARRDAGGSRAEVTAVQFHHGTRLASPDGMRTLLLIAILTACSGSDNSEDGDEPPGPTCSSVLSLTRYCQEAGLGNDGRECNPDGRDDGTWPVGCTEVNEYPGTVEICCP